MLCILEHFVYVTTYVPTVPNRLVGNLGHQEKGLWNGSIPFTMRVSLWSLNVTVMLHSLYYFCSYEIKRHHTTVNNTDTMSGS